MCETPGFSENSYKSLLDNFSSVYIQTAFLGTKSKALTSHKSLMYLHLRVIELGSLEKVFYYYRIELGAPEH